MILIERTPAGGLGRSLVIVVEDSPAIARGRRREGPRGLAHARQPACSKKECLDRSNERTLPPSLISANVDGKHFLGYQEGGSPQGLKKKGKKEKTVGLGERKCAWGLMLADRTRTTQLARRKGGAKARSGLDRGLFVSHVA